MYTQNKVQIKTPWAEVNGLFDNEGIDAGGLWLLPVINREHVQDFFAHLAASQINTLDVEQHQPLPNQTIAVAHMCAKQKLPSFDATVAQYISDHTKKPVGPSFNEMISFNETAFKESNLKFFNWNISDSTPLDEVVSGISDGLHSSNVDMRLCLIDGTDLDMYSSASVRVILREIRMWALQQHALVMLTVPTCSKRTRFHDEKKNPFIDAVSDSPICAVYQHTAINQEADGELLIGHNYITQELVIRRGKYRGSVKKYGEEVRINSLVGEFPEWDVM